VRELRHRP